MNAASVTQEIAALRVALIGYGEVGGIFGAALVGAGVGGVAAFDVKRADAAWTARATARATRDGVALAGSTREAVADADLVISAVTAAASADGGRSDRGGLPRRHLRAGSQFGVAEHQDRVREGRGACRRSLRRSGA